MKTPIWYRCDTFFNQHLVLCIQLGYVTLVSLHILSSSGIQISHKFSNRQKIDKKLFRVLYIR